jgi:hypothetical protein
LRADLLDTSLHKEKCASRAGVERATVDARLTSRNDLLE